MNGRFSCRRICQRPAIHLRRLGVEPLEDRRLLSAYAGDQAIELLDTSPAPFVEMMPDAAEEAHAGGISDATLVLQPAELPLQPVGVPFVDPVFGTTLRRVSDASENGRFETQIYNQLQAFSADNEYLLLTGSQGYLVRRVDDLSRVQGLDTSPWNAPRWHPVQAHKIVHFDSNADTTVRVQLTDVDTLTTTTVFTFPSQYQYVLGNQSFDELSQDGRWLAGMVIRDDGVRSIFSLDLESRALGVEVSIPEIYAGPAEPDPVWGELEPDWVGVSPLGNYLVVQWVRGGTERASGLETFDIQTGEFIGRVTDHHHHGDLGVDSDGVTEIFMTTEFAPPFDNNAQASTIHELPGPSTGLSPPIWLRVVPWTDEDHYSLQGPDGVGLLSWGRFDEGEGPNQEPFENELFLQYTDGSVLRLAHHRSSKCGYWSQTRASISRDGRYVVFASDWGQQASLDNCSQGEFGLADAYIIDLRADDEPAEVVGRHVFYNNSAYVGQQAIAPSPDDLQDAGKDPKWGKQALLPGRTATFQNYTTYSLGLNGIMVEIANLPVATTRLTAADFEFRTGNSSDLETWSDPAVTPQPQNITLDTSGDGPARVFITWADNAIQNQWLQVTVKANESTSLPAGDVFYFGNTTGESGNLYGDADPDALVTYADLIQTRNNIGLTTEVTIENGFDFNRDKFVTYSDLILCRNNINLTSGLNPITAPFPAAGAAAAHDAVLERGLEQKPAEGSTSLSDLAWILDRERFIADSRPPPQHNPAETAVRKLLATWP